MTFLVAHKITSTNLSRDKRASLSFHIFHESAKVRLYTASVFAIITLNIGGGERVFLTHGKRIFYFLLLPSQISVKIRLLTTFTVDIFFLLYIFFTFLFDFWCFVFNINLRCFVVWSMFMRSSRNQNESKPCKFACL